MAVKIGPPASWERKAASPVGRMVIWRGCESLAFHHLPEAEGSERNEVAALLRQDGLRESMVLPISGAMSKLSVLHSGLW